MYSVAGVRDTYMCGVAGVNIFVCLVVQVCGGCEEIHMW